MDTTACLQLPKFARLPSELRGHIISYNSFSTLAKYAQCSKLCNTEIQQYNTRPPYRIKLAHDEEHVTVDLFYKRNNNYKFNIALRFFKINSPLCVNESSLMIQIFHKEPYEVAIKYVKDRLKHVQTEECDVLDFYGNAYLPELMTIAKVHKFNWIVIFDETMYHKLYDSVKTEKNERLGMEMVPKTNKVYNIPVEFFRSEFFQNLSHFECTFSLPGLQDEEFLAMKAHKIAINCSTISDRAINQKIQQWASNPANQPVEYKFSRSNPTFNESVILENLNITDTRRFIRTIEIQHPTGSLAALYYYGTSLIFRTI